MSHDQKRLFVLIYNLRASRVNFSSYEEQGGGEKYMGTHLLDWGTVSCVALIVCAF